MDREKVIKTAKENYEKKPLDFEIRPELDIYTTGMIDGYKMAEKKLSSEFSDQCDELYRDYEKRLKQLREENEISNKHILELQADKGKLTDKVNELEAQIGKMKCCGNCKHDYDEEQYITTDYCNDCFDFNKWEVNFGVSN